VTHLSTLSEDEGGINEEDFPFALHKEHCIIAVKAKVTRKEAQLIHANVDADVIISPPLHGNKKPDQIYGIAERFVQGLRRLRSAKTWIERRTIHSRTEKRSRERG
jgi:N6-adenosine-specific RNA methylase IME4